MMVEIKLRLSNNWKRRLLGWSRDLILVFAMWSVWLVREYVPDTELVIKNVITGFIITILTLTILVREYVDYTIVALEAQLLALKQS